MANTVVSVKIQLENGQYITASNQVIASTQKIERESAKSMSKLDKVGDTFSRRMKRYFSLGALFGGAFMTAYRAVSALFGAIGKGLGQAINNNKALKASLDDMAMNFELLFYNIGEALTPIVAQLVEVGNFVANLFNKSKSAGWSKQSLEGMKRSYEYQKDKGIISKDDLQALNEVNQKLEAIYKKEQMIAKIEMEKNAKAKLEVEKKISDEFEKQKNALKEQLGIVKSLTDDLMSMLPQGEFTQFTDKLTDVINKFEELQKQAEISGKSIAEVFASFVSQNWLDLAIKAIGSIIQALQDWGKEQWENYKKTSKEATEAKYEKYLDGIRAKIKELTTEMIKLNHEVSREEIIRNDNVEAINREIKAKEDLYKTNQDFIDQAKANAEATGYGSGPEDYQNYYDMASQMREDVSTYLEQADYWKNQIANPFLNMEQRAEAIRNMQYFIDTYNEQMSKADVYEAIGADLEKAYQLELDNLGITNDIADLNQELVDLAGTQLEIQEAITDEIEKQKDLMKDMVDLGMDLENIRTVKGLTKQLSAFGLSGVDLGTALQDVGVQNKAIAGRTLNIFGDINNTLNQASVNATITSLNNIINRLGGV